MKPIKTFKVLPRLPQKIERLRELAHNLYWCWNHEAVSLLRRIDRDLWEATEHNPVRMLGMISQQRLEELAADDGFLAHFRRVIEDFDAYINDPKWYQKNHADRQCSIAYFSAEFGITESLPIYSGGLGILAGDHLKSASDLGLPLIGIGLLYQHGYFRQHLNYDGWQAENYPINDFYNMALDEVKNPDGSECVVSVDFPQRPVFAKVWQANVGRVKLYLLDTNISRNAPADQDITDELYGGDLEMRIRQEILLGIGGMRMLAQLGISPTVCHMNEGHSAFLGLERIRLLLKAGGLSFGEALEYTRAGNVFTTHTPVPAGIDVFPADLMRKYFFDYSRELGIGWDDFLALGAETRDRIQQGFSMAALALHLSAQANGVSALHGKVSRGIFRSVWPGLPEDEVPILSVTNGIHHRSWISNDMEALYQRYLGDRWLVAPQEHHEVDIDEIPDEELWRTHERRRERLVAFARRRLRQQLTMRGAPASEIRRAEEALDPEILTIGFARRFATYKRADLILRNPDRLAKILNNPEMPVQIIFSGKAHPRDNPGKELIRELVHIAERDQFRKRIVFLEDYDISIARYLVQGVDVWLNTPRRLYEASGTSGMKAAVNGVLNMSILDGWWDEAYQLGIGWAIGKSEEYTDINYQYDIEANAIYDLLDKELIPLFYRRGADRLPREWIRCMKDSIKKLYPRFNTHRMVSEYATRFYVKADERYRMLGADGFARARQLAAYRDRLRRNWQKIRIEDVRSDVGESVMIGGRVSVNAVVFLDSIDPREVDVQVYHGLTDTDGMIFEGAWNSLSASRKISEGRHEFSGHLPCTLSGMQGLSVRVLPRHELLDNPYIPEMITWA